MHFDLFIELESNPQQFLTSYRAFLCSRECPRQIRAVPEALPHRRTSWKNKDNFFIVRITQEP
jgi:hypothetical protein